MDFSFPAYGNVYFFFMLLRVMVVRPIRPLPKRSMVNGSGTFPAEATVIQPKNTVTIITKVFITYPFGVKTAL